MLFSSLKKIIKKRLRTMRRRLSKHLFAESMLKRRGIEARLDDIEILGIGSSHCTRGFDSDMIDKAFNLGVVDQDLYSTHYIFDQYIDEFKNLKHVIAFYSVHSQGHELCKTSSVKNTVVSHYVFGVPYNVDYLKKWRRAVQHRFKTFDDSNIDYKTFSGYVPEKKNPNVTPPTPEFRCAHHLRENRRIIKQNHHLFKMAEVCQKKGIQFSIVIAPCRSDFLKELEKYHFCDEELFYEVFHWAKENNVPILNELHATDYEWDDFYDCDHLDISGAKKLTKKIADFIQVPLK